MIKSNLTCVLDDSDEDQPSVRPESATFDSCWRKVERGAARCLNCPRQYGLHGSATLDSIEMVGGPDLGGGHRFPSVCCLQGCAGRDSAKRTGGSETGRPVNGSWSRCQKPSYAPPPQSRQATVRNFPTSTDRLSWRCTGPKRECVVHLPEHVREPRGCLAQLRATLDFAVTHRFYTFQVGNSGTPASRHTSAGLGNRSFVR